MKGVLFTDFRDVNPNLGLVSLNSQTKTLKYADLSMSINCLFYLPKLFPMHNKDFRKELQEGQEIKYLVARTCPKCNGKIIALPPDRAWCENTECNYAEMHIIGDGVMAEKLKTYPLIPY